MFWLPAPACIEHMICMCGTTVTSGLLGDSLIAQKESQRRDMACDRIYGSSYIQAGSSLPRPVGAAAGPEDVYTESGPLGGSRVSGSRPYFRISSCSSASMTSVEMGSSFLGKSRVSGQSEPAHTLKVYHRTDTWVRTFYELRRDLVDMPGG